MITRMEKTYGHGAHSDMRDLNFGFEPFNLFFKYGIPPPSPFYMSNIKKKKKNRAICLWNDHRLFTSYLLKQIQYTVHNDWGFERLN